MALGLTAQWQQVCCPSLKGYLQGMYLGPVRPFSSAVVEAHPGSFSVQPGGSLADGVQAGGTATGCCCSLGWGFFFHRVGVNPENFLRVLQKTQLNKIHKQAIIQVAALPGSSLAPVGWVVSPSGAYC